MKRSKHNLSHTKLLSCKMGELVPIGLIEILPGDSIQMQSRLLIRLAPMLAPPMHAVRARVHHFFVPHRLVWDNWEAFITGGSDGNNASVMPYTPTPINVGEPYDYYGCGTIAVASSGHRITALPGRGYNLIWNEYYRDQDLQTARAIAMGDGADSVTQKGMANVCWEKDTFTAARPWQQKGPVVTIPLGGAAVLTGQATFKEGTAAGPTITLERQGGGLGSNVVVQQAGTALADVIVDLTSGGATISGAGITVNSLRQSLAIQRFEEARALYGSRYPEYLRAIGVRSSDARLQRPEYLGGGVQTLQFSEVLQTAQDGTNPVGTLRGHGISALRSNRFRRFFEEHGYLHSFVSVIPKTVYTEGMQRHFMKQTKYEYWQRELENIGVQDVWDQQLRAQAATWKSVFGYEPRYDEYRRIPSQVAGEFKQTALNYWHFAREFATQPVLNSTFVSAVPPERPFAAQGTNDTLYIQVHNSVQSRRLVSQRHIPRTF